MNNFPRIDYLNPAINHFQCSYDASCTFVYFNKTLGQFIISSYPIEPSSDLAIAEIIAYYPEEERGPSGELIYKKPSPVINLDKREDYIEVLKFYDNERRKQIEASRDSDKCNNLHSQNDNIDFQEEKES